MEKRPPYKTAIALLRQAHRNNVHGSEVDRLKNELQDALRLQEAAMRYLPTVQQVHAYKWRECVRVCMWAHRCAAEGRR